MSQPDYLGLDSSRRQFLTSDTLRWIVWKENRMVVPLFGALVGVVLLVVVFHSLTNFHEYRSLRSANQYLPLLFPTLLAAGLGFVLVGQEREQRTLDWLRAQPLLPARLVGVKVAVALVWLIGAWLLSLLFSADLGWSGEISYTEIVPTQSIANSQLIPLSYPYWLVQSVFILTASFYASWRCITPLRGLILLFAVACLPVLVNVLIGSMVHLRSEQLLRLSFGFTVLLTPAIGLLAFRAARKTLSPTLAPASTTGQIATRYSSTSNAFACRMPSFGSIQSALGWQAFSSGRSVLLSLVGIMIIVPLVSALTAIVQWPSGIEALLQSTMLLVPLAASWAGVIVFQGDGSSERLRFLADRGCSPRIVYWGRHLPMISVLSGLVIAYTLFASFMVISFPNADGTITLFSSLTVTVVLGILYATGQWISQLVRGPVIAFLVAPVIGLVSFGWLVFCTAQLTAPMWMIAVLGIVIPMVASRVLMRRYMDGTERPLSFVIGMVAAGLLIGLPLIPAMSYIASIPTMPSDQRASLLNTGRAALKTSANAIALKTDRMEASRPVSYERFLQGLAGTGTNTGLAGALLEADENVINDLAQWMDEQPRTATAMIQGLDELTARPTAAAYPHDRLMLYAAMPMLNIAELQFRHAHSEDSEATEREATERFEQWIDAASRIAVAYRRNARWSTQELADVLEIWIADVLSDAELTDRMNKSLLSQSLARLPNIDERNKARRRGVLASWASYLEDSPRYRSFAYDHGIQYTPAALQPWTKDRRAEAIVRTAIEALEAPSNTAWLPRMQELQSHPLTPPDDDPYGTTFRSIPAIQTLDLNQQYPGRYWGMPWEKTIDALREQYREQ